MPDRERLGCLRALTLTTDATNGIRNAIRS